VGKVHSRSGLGYREVEDGAFGVRKEEKARKLGEALEVIKLLWEREGNRFQWEVLPIKKR